MVDCKTCEYEKICELPDFVRNDLKKCRTYLEKKPQTNADRIRAMSDEELAEFLSACCVEELGGGACVGDCKQCYLQWLQKEVKEEQ